MRAIFYCRYAARSLARGRERTMLAIGCVAVGVLVLVALQLVGAMINVALVQNARAFNGADLAVHSEIGIPPQQLQVLARLKARGAITAYTPAAVSGATALTPSGGQYFTFFTVDPAAFPLAGSLQFLTPAHGTLSSLLHGTTVVITTMLRDQLRAHRGETFGITTDDGRVGTITIGGVITISGPLSGRADLLISERGYDSLLGFAHAALPYTWVWVNVAHHSAAAATAVARQIRRQIQQVTTTTVPQAEQHDRAIVDSLRTSLQILGLLALLLGGAGIAHTMHVLLRRRYLEIALLKAQGYRQRDLLVLFGLEAGILGLLGGALGALGGIGLSLLVQSLVERAFLLTLPTVIDPGIVFSGVGIGVATALTCGVLPIVQAGAVRPLAVLRGTGQHGSRSRSSARLLCLLAALFFLLALGILHNPLVAALVVVGAGFLLGLLTSAFSLLTWMLSLLPVLEISRWWYALLMGLLLLVLGLAWLAPAPGVLLLVPLLGGSFVVSLPRWARAKVYLTLRSIDRARVRSATTLTALFVGVFATGLGLALGQGLRDLLVQLSASHNRYNAYVLAGGADASVVAMHLKHVPGLAHLDVYLDAPGRIVAVNGRTVSGNGAGAAVSGFDGIDLRRGQLPPITLAQGLQDTHPGRLLTPADTGTTNAVVSLGYSQAPYRMRLGARVAISNLAGTRSVTIHIVGFYEGGGTFGGFSAVLIDRGAVLRLGGRPYVVYACHLDPATSTAVLTEIRNAVPGVITVSDAAFLQQIDTVLDNITQLVEALALLTGLAGLTLIANTVALALLERQRELGIFKAIGYTSRSILALVLLENGVLGLVGACCALLLVSLCTSVVGQLALHSITAAALAPSVEVEVVAVTVALCLGVAVAGAWGATHVRPLEVLRYE